MNPLVEMAFIFVSVTLGIKWAIEALVQYGLAKRGLLIMKEKETLVQMEEDDEDF